MYSAPAVEHDSCGPSGGPVICVTAGGPIASGDSRWTPRPQWGPRGWPEALLCPLSYARNAGPRGPVEAVGLEPTTDGLQPAVAPPEFSFRDFIDRRGPTKVRRELALPPASAAGFPTGQRGCPP